MKPSLSLAKKNRFPFRRKAVALSLILVAVFSILFIPLSSAKAQVLTSDISAVAQRIQIDTGSKLLDKILTALAKAGSVSFQQLMKTALNKIAYDTATYIGSGGKGQKPLFVTEDWGKYLVNIADQSTGQFIENFVNTFSDSTASYKAQQEYGSCADSCKKTYDECSSNSLNSSGASGVIINKQAANECQASLTTCVKSCRETVTEQEKILASTTSATVKVSGESGSSRRIVNVCEPSSIQAKLKISLGLAEVSEPNLPNCSATELIQNWGDEYKRLTSFENPDFLNMVENAFNPVSNDLGIYMSLKTDLTKEVEAEVSNSKLKLSANKGWLDVRNIAGEQKATPGTAQYKDELAKMNYGNALLKTTGDIVVDAANLFLNQLSLTAFNNLMDSLGEKAKNTQNFTEYGADPTVAYGEANIKEAAVKVIPLNLRTDADYNVLIGLSSCPDRKNPGPTECVIDNLFMQAISEKKTVAEALNAGYLNKDWVLTKDNKENAYTLRNISILRKYRILPLTWEQTIEKIYVADSNISSKRQKATLMDLVSCFDADDEYANFSRDFDPKDAGWCEGLIDPNWVLKAPLGYCAKEGIGGRVVFGGATPGSSQDGVVIPSVYNITRSDNYCADEKTCIKENARGGCDVYGYCNEEKRIWRFDSDTCEPVYNTCETFTNSTGGKQVSYLKNTIDYSGCSADNAGCSRYSVSGDFSKETGMVTWDPAKSLYMTKMEGCSRGSEGCTELIRVKPTWGANLIMNADFGNDKLGDSVSNRNKLNDWPISASVSSYSAKIVEANEETGSNSGPALMISASGPSSASSPLLARVYSEPNNSLLPDNFQLLKGESYTLSADVYVVNGEKAVVYLGTSGTAITSAIKETTGTGRWENISITRTASDSYDEPMFGVQVIDTRASANSQVGAYVKNIKFELSNVSTDFSLYSEYRVYQKLIPPYLENACYVNNGNDYTLRDDAPAICLDFTRRCNASEAGCEAFVNSRKSLNIAAKVTSSDYCPGRCVGYDMYISRQDYFNPTQAENIIPDQLTKCSSVAVGCSEFTNLDNVNLGGESREYYSELKQCIKPSSECSSFYNWERTANGSQLRLYTLQKDSSGNPKVTTNDSTECNADIFKKLPGDTLYNPDCKEFYNVDGQISYHLLSRTITCSENCVSYRLSSKNFDYSLSQSACSARGKAANWDASVKACQVCLNGGSWDSQLSACVYQAIPGEGQKCSSREVGCREYNGSDGNNLKILSSYSFESGLQGWNSNCSNGLEASDISSNKNGHSLFYRNNATGCSPIGSSAGSTASNNRLINKVFASDNVAAQLEVGQLVSQEKSYTLRFIAKSNQGDAKLKIYFYNNQPADPKMSYFGEEDIVVRGGDTWNIYQVNLSELDHEVTSNETLVISADKDFYFDDVILTEISDRYYLIKGSAQVPSECFYDVNGSYQGDKYNLGCSAYTDRAGNVHSLRKFSSLCSNSSVGCEQMIKTQNYEPYKSGTWKDLNNNGACDPSESDCVEVAADEAIYAIYEKSKVCNAADKGCSLLGQTISGTSDWSDVYKKNNPNIYDMTICGQADLGCSAWKTKEGGLSYFKDPGNQVCQYRSGKDSPNSAKAWYMVPVSRCDINDSKAIEIESEQKICKSDKDCGEYKCIVDNNDYPCETSYFKTFGLGGNGNVIPTPNTKVGLCEPAASGCTEYIDPVSSISPNLIADPNFQISDSSGPWNGGSQTVNIEPNKLYSFSVGNGVIAPELKFNRDVRQLLSNNNLGSNTSSISVQPGKNVIFFSMANNSVVVIKPEKDRTLTLKEVIVNYQLRDAVNKTECKTVNVDNGCVLFNERSVNGTSTPTSLSGRWDAFSSSKNKAPVSCGTDGQGCNANSLIKVSPDRVCAKWLDCVSYTINEAGQKVCYTIGECNRLEGTECVSYEEVGSAQAMNFDYRNVSKNATGYLLLNRYHLANMKEVGLNTDAHYDFEDAIPVLACERIDGRGPCNFNNIAKELLVREPAGAPVKYPASGKTYLKVPAGYLISPQTKDTYINVVKNKTYYLNLLVNTEAGSGAFVKITGKNGNNISSNSGQTVGASNNGWSRKVISFSSGDYDELRIELGSNGATGAVYFDDVNIEPVLQVGQDEYLSKECRLYPTADSLTCVNKNDTTVKDGLEGYCLEHDRNNPEVCLMWYPVDKISSARTSGNTEGYKGKYPLNYCTEVDGNFDLVKKLEANQVMVSDFGNSATIGLGGAQYCYAYNENTKEFDKFGDSNWAKVFDSCGNGSSYAGSCYDKYSPEIFEKAKSLCRGEYKPVVAIGERSGASRSYFKIMCIPIKSKLIDYFKTTKTIEQMDGCNGIEYQEGWAIYNGFLNKLNYDSGSGSEYCEETISDGVKDPWCEGIYDGIDEEKIKDPVRVFDYNKLPSDEDELKLISSSDPEKNFRLACNNFIQMVDSSGENKAWADRVSINSLFSTTTPTFFKDYGKIAAGVWYGSSTSHNLQGYGRNREDVPFGAALLPDNFDLLSNDGAINLRNQYSSKMKETILAGRPYGCSNYKTTDSGEGCNNIGYCSLNPNVYCLSSVREGSQLQISVDDVFVAYFNGDEILKSPTKAPTINLSSSEVEFLKKEKNVLAIKAEDKGGQRGIAAAIEGVMNTNSLSGWKCSSSTPPANWTAVGFNDNSWAEAEFSKTNCSDCESNFTSYKQIWAKGAGVKSTVYCRYSFTNNTDGYVSRKTCSSGGFGTCVPLWGEYLGSGNTIIGAENDYTSILSQLFLKSYNSYTFSGETYTIGGLKGIDKVSSATGTKPTISNVYLTLNGNRLPLNSDYFNIQEKNLYRLEFNTFVDKEQQPLREIYINWGDGNSQVVKGEDNRIDLSRPHIVYHYYSSVGPKKIEIEIKDNWGKKALWP